MSGRRKKRTIDLELLTREYCAEMGWDPATGWPGRQKLKELGLEGLIREERGL